MRLYLCALVLQQALHTLCMVRSGSLMNRLIKVEHVHHENQDKFDGPKPKWHSILGKDMDWRDRLCNGVTSPDPISTMPEHIDVKQYEVTSPIPFITLGPIPGIDHHPPLLNISSCERIYIDHFEKSDSVYDYTDESLEMIQIPHEELYKINPLPNPIPYSMDFAAIPGQPMYPMYEGGF